VRQLSEGEFRATHTELTTSSFAVPSYSMRASKAYVREIPTGDPRYGTMTEFYANDVTLRAFGLPYFYLPAVGGEFTQRGFPLRNLVFGDSTRFGFGVKTDWGLMEALGILPPPDVDANLRLDYFGERGPGFGVDVNYGGGYVTQTSKQPWNFQGTFKSYFVPDDQGIDDLGRHRADVPPPQTFRGRIRWEHQQFLPNDWQVQLKSGWVSDPNFLEEWFEPEFNDGPPLETSFYAKKQKDSEALTLLVTFQPNNIVTTSNLYQETVGPIIPGLFEPTAANKPFEIERLPEIGYHRIGESIGDRATLFSDNVFSGLRYNPGVATLGFVPPNSESLGFRSPNKKFPEGVLPGIPAQGTTGTTNEWIYRGDFREEVDFPFGVGQLRFLPYVMGRYTGYSDSPNLGQLNRFYTGAGLRINTAFWKIDNSAESELLDIHRVRHVIEPELQLFTSAATEDRSDPFIYDMDVDAINDVSAVSGGLRQRWQTKRGGPGNERSVDFFTLNVNATFYANKPPANVMPPGDFRGLYFSTLPEASIPRDSFNGEALWRVTNSTAIIADASYNIEAANLATAGIGLAARRGERIGFFVGTRYIEDLSSAITTVAFQYQLTAKYSVVGRWSFDFGDQEQVYTSISVQRKFDRFFMVLTVYDDAVNNNSGFGFAIYPEGLGQGLSTQALAGVFGK